MEHAEAAADMVWSTLAAAAVPSVESDIAQCFFPYDQEHESMEAMAAMFLPCLDADSNSSSACVNFDASPYSWPQLGSIAPAQNYESCGFSGTDLAAIGVDLSTAPYANHSGHQMPVAHKRKSVSAATGSIKFRKGGKGDPVRDDDDTVHVDTQSSSSCTSEEGNVDGNARRSSKKAATRAGRGAATDPQSLYARKRRERINERLRILQNLIPNGTKVDISTMLEEAVQYVKFLQLQIKLLSSDDLWMYAPIAYNGVNINDLDLKLSVLKK